MEPNLFTPADLEQINRNGSNPDKVLSEIETFKSGFPYTMIKQPCTVDKGIKVISEKGRAYLCELHEQAAASGRFLKFVPASGAATRMFKHLQPENPEAVFANQAENRVKPEYRLLFEFLEHLEDFPFYHDLKDELKKNNFNLNQLLQEKNYKIILEHLLTDKGLNYAALPKALLKFHHYETGNRCALEEHLVEGALYAKDQDKKVKIHFTVSPEHLDLMKARVEEVRSHYEDVYDARFEISYSVQKTSTDTIAVDPDNQPFRDRDGKLLFRPGGHGALIENLNDLAGDIIFIKNIDNVVPDHLKETTILYKKILVGYLVAMQEQIFSYLQELSEPTIDENLLSEIAVFAETRLAIFQPCQTKHATKEEKRKFLFSKLNRPLRVCGMVKNEGEPGGGPFWVSDPNGNLSLQIVEASQINTSEPEQKEQLERATHFNPVDLVCGVRDYQGKPFELKNYIDPNTGFISRKSKDGKELKALELPGLWNGAMADWNTCFIEVPVITFNPVKTVNDLLRPNHKPHHS